MSNIYSATAPPTGCAATTPPMAAPRRQRARCLLAGGRHTGAPALDRSPRASRGLAVLTASLAFDSGSSATIDIEQYPYENAVLYTVAADGLDVQGLVRERAPGERGAAGEEPLRRLGRARRAAKRPHPGRARGPLRPPRGGAPATPPPPVNRTVWECSIFSWRPNPIRAILRRIRMKSDRIPDATPPGVDPQPTPKHTPVGRCLRPRATPIARHGRPPRRRLAEPLGRCRGRP